MGVELNVLADRRYLSYEKLHNQIPGPTLVTAVRKILEQLPGRKSKIEILRFFGHGQPGHQFVGPTGGYGERIRWLDGKLLGRGNLRLLKGKFTRHGWVELRGCHVAEGDAGEHLLHAVADLLEVPVLAATGEQTDVLDPLAWENRVAQAAPGVQNLIWVIGARTFGSALN